MSRSVVFKVAIAVPSAVLIGLLISMVGDRIVDPPTGVSALDLRRPDYIPLLTTRSGEPLSERRHGLKLRLDPLTLFSNLPNQRNGSFEIDCRGFRADAGIVEHPRTFVLGGSAAFGQPLGPGELPFPALLQQAYPELNCVNAAVVGFTSSQELALMVHTLDDYQPRLYIVFDGWNDLIGPFSGAASWPALDTQLEFNPMLDQIENRLRATLHPSAVERDRTTDLPCPIQSTTLDREVFFERVAAKYRTNLERMAGFAVARAARIVVVFQPELGQKKRPTFHELSGLEAADRVYGYLERDFPDAYRTLVRSAKRTCEDQGIAYLDLATEGPFVEASDELFADTVHLNQVGHRLVFNQITEFMIENGLLTQ